KTDGGARVASTRPAAREPPPIPMQPAATRNRRAVAKRIATLPDLRLDGPGRLAATQKENDRTREPKQAEFRRAIDRSSGDEFAPTICDHTILVRLHRDGIFRATQNLPLRVQ